MGSGDSAILGCFASLAMSLRRRPAYWLSATLPPIGPTPWGTGMSELA